MMAFRAAPLTVMALFALLSVNGLLLAAIVANSVGNGNVPLYTAEWSPKLSTPGDDTAIAPKPLGAYRQILAQPAFSKTRTPFVPPRPAPVAVRPKTAPRAPVITNPGLVLGGVAIADGVRKAYLSAKSDARGTWVAEGEEFKGWRVQSVNGANVKIAKSGRTFELTLYPKL